MNKQLVMRMAILSSLLFLLSSAEDDEEGFTEVITPLRCTIPGEIYITAETKSILDKYKQ